jgi:hypothetical protein
VLSWPARQQRPGALTCGRQTWTFHRNRPLIKGQGLLVWADAEISSQVRAQPLELPHGRAPVSGVDRTLHQRAVGFLIGGVNFKYPLPQPGRFEQPQVQRAQPFARLFRPWCITVLGEQVSVIGIERADLAGPSRRFEGDRVNRQLPVGAEFQHPARAADGGRRAQGSTSEVNGLAQVGRGRVRGKVGPEQVHDLLAVQAVRVGQGEDLNQFGCPLVPPCVGRNRLAVNPDHEPAQQPDLIAGHGPNLTGKPRGCASLCGPGTLPRARAAPTALACRVPCGGWMPVTSRPG